MSAADGHRPSMQRVVALIDMDCFYCACERALDPSLVGIPMAVVQYNPFEGNREEATSNLVGGVVSLPAEPARARVVVRNGKIMLPRSQNGSIIAVSYEARARGVTRFFRGKEAVAHCPEIVLVQVPTAHGKSDMSLYRAFGARALKLIAKTCGDGTLVEKASVDEMYLDVTVPAKALLHGAQRHADIYAEALDGGTHVAGSAEAHDEAGRGAQPGGVLARNSFRAGHAGQQQRAVDDASASWWSRAPPEWPPDETILAAGAVIVARARAAVTAELGFTCSAGIAANKLLGKLTAGLHKPNQQTVLPPSSVRSLLDPLPVDRLRGFGSKLGELLRTGRPDIEPPLEGFETVGALRRAGPAVVAKVLRGEWNHPEEKAEEAWRMACGEDMAAVEERALPKQVGSSKNFGGNRGKDRGPLDTRESLERWVRELSADIVTRCEAEAEDNLREPTMLVCACRFEDDGFGWNASKSKRCAIRGATSLEALTRTAMGLLLALATGRPPHRLGVSLLGLTVEGFVPTAAAGGGALKRMFEAGAAAAAPAAVGPTQLADAAEGSDRGRSDRGVRAAEGAAPAEEPAAKRERATLGGGEPRTASVVELAEAGERAGEEQLWRNSNIVNATSATAVVQRAAEPEPWTCGACTLINEADVRRCIVCDCMRGGSLAAAVTLAEQQPQGRGGGRRGGSARGRGRGGTAGLGSSGTGRQQAGIASFMKQRPPA